MTNDDLVALTIFIIVFVVLVAIGLVVLIICLICGFSRPDKDKSKKSSYTTYTSVSQSHGTQIGGGQELSFFAPSNDRAGVIGERVVNRELLSILFGGEYLLTGLLLPLKNGEFTEIDSVILSRKGIFCIEIKNWVGTIEGTDEDEYWTQIYDDPYRPNRKNKNPVKQNDAHCGVLSKLLFHHFEIKNVVIFPKIETNYINSSHAFTTRKFIAWYRSLPNALTFEEINQIKQKLVKYVASSEQLKAHAESVKRKNQA